MGESLITRRGAVNQREYLYKDGTEVVAWTGEGGRLTKEATYIQYECNISSVNETLTLSTSSTVNLTAYNKLCMEGRLEITTASGSIFYFVRFAIGSIEGLLTQPNGTGARLFEHVWDISDRTGNQTLRVRFRNWDQRGTMRVYKIWLEK
jgi:hypothetical protein